MPIVLALCSACLYGIADYGGGKASRAHPSAIVTAIAQIMSLAIAVVIVAAMGTAAPGLDTGLWGVSAGVCGAASLACLYHAFAHGSMAVVAPLSAVVAAILPVGVGLTSGERPQSLAYAGIGLALVAVTLISTGDTDGSRATPPRIVLLAVTAGLAGGLMFVALDRSAHDSGFWPLLIARMASVTLLLAFCVATRARPGPHRSMLWIAAAIGALDIAANALYLQATREGLLSIVAVVSSLYPAGTVALAFVIDRERPSRPQRIGIALAAIALGLVTIGRAS